jgi:hypothetical protein
MDDTVSAPPQGKATWLDEPFNPEHGTRLSYPLIQWYNARNSEMAEIHPVLGNGGWEWPMDSFGRATATGEIPAGFSEARKVKHQNGKKTIMAMLAEKLSVAVLAHRSAWRNKDTGRYLRPGQYTADMNVEKIVNLLVYVKGADTISPVVLTLSGRGSTEAILDILKTFDDEVVALASQIKHQPVPRYAFWLTIESGGPKEIKSKRMSESSMATPPVIVLDRPALADPRRRVAALGAMFVGPEMKALCEQTYPLAQLWVKQYDTAASQDDAPDDDVPPMPDEEMPD